MLNSKEKAKDLIEKFLPNVYCYMGSGMLSNDYDKNVALMYAKKCALIAVQELINETTCLWKIIGDDLITYPEFWISVKEEIENYQYE